VRAAPLDALILDAKLRQSLVVVRSLGRRGMRLATVEVENLSECVPTFLSRWSGPTLLVPPLEPDPTRFVECVERLVDEHRPRVLLPSADGTLSVLRRFRTRFEHRTAIALASEAALAVAVNKQQTLALARELRIGVPRGVHIADARDTAAALREVGLPAVVKPVESWISGERLFCELVTTRDEATRAVESLTQTGGSVLFQQFLAGRREAVSLFYASGRVHARFAQWAKRMQPPLGGTSVFRKSIEVPPDLGEPAEALVRAIDLEGYSEIEFRRDADERPYLMEINPRLSASVEVAVRAGVDFPLLIHQWASGTRISRVDGYRAGRWMRYLEGDLQTTLQCVRQRGRPGVTPPAQAMLEFAAAFFVPSGYDYFSWDDVGPALEVTRNFGRTVARHIRRHI
jgi:predicted ATP-grasp superfamily ATP-dependent carboligase